MLIEGRPMRALTVTLVTVLTCIWVAESKAATKVVSKAATKVVSKAAKSEVAEPEVATPNVTQPTTEPIDPLRQKKEKLVHIAIDSLYNYFGYFDRFIRLFMHPEPPFLDAPIGWFLYKNEFLKTAITNLVPDKDKFIDAGRVDKYVDDGKVWATLKHIRELTNTMKEEIEPIYQKAQELKDTNDRMYAFIEVDDATKDDYPQEEKDKFHEYVSLFKKIIGRYIAVFKYVKSFLSHHTDILKADEFMKQYENTSTDKWRRLNDSLHKMDDGMSYSRQERYVPAMKRMYVLSKELDTDLVKLEGLLL